MAHDCYEQTHAIDWSFINSALRSFRQNIRLGYQSTLIFQPDEGRLSLTCEAGNGYVGMGTVSRERETEEEG